MDQNITLYSGNDDLFCRIGGKLTDILNRLNLLERDFVYISKQQSQNTFVLPDKIINLLDNKVIYSSPPKLPMIVPPKVFNPESLAGYFLNDEYYAEELIINKAGYNKPYEISHNNVIFDMVNNISKTPSKINTALLEFI